MAWSVFSCLFRRWSSAWRCWDDRGATGTAAVPQRNINDNNSVTINHCQLHHQKFTTMPSTTVTPFAQGKNSPFTHYHMLHNWRKPRIFFSLYTIIVIQLFFFTCQCCRSSFNWFYFFLWISMYIQISENPKKLRLFINYYTFFEFIDSDCRSVSFVTLWGRIECLPSSIIVRWIHWRNRKIDILVRFFFF